MIQEKFINKNIFYSCPFLFLFSFLVTGILSGSYFSVPVCLEILFLCFSLCFILFSHKKRVFFVSGLCLALFFIGNGRANSIENGYNDAANLVSFAEKYKVWGQIVSFPSTKELNKRRNPVENFKTSFVINVSQVLDGNGSLLDFEGKVQIFLYTQDKPQFKLGDKLLLNTSLNRSFALSNPHQFDYRQYLKNKGIYLVAYIKDVKNISKIAQGNICYRSVDFCKRKMIAVISQNVETETNQAFLAAVILGNRDLLTKEMRDDFLKTGTVHILAVSGLHLGIITMIIFFLLRLFLKQRKYIYATTLVIITFYAIVVGLRPSVLRALIMVAVFISARLLGRQNSLLNSLFIAGVLVLLINPYDVYSVGFLFSFIIVFFLITLTPQLGKSFLKEKIIEDRFYRAKRKFVFFLTGCLIAQAAVFPLVLYYNNLFSLSSFFINIILIPFMYPVLLTGFLFCFLGAFCPFALPLLKGPAVFFSSLLVGITNYSASFKELYFYVASFSFWALFVYYIGLGFLLRKSLRKIGLLLIFGFVFYVGLNHYLNNNNFKITFLSLGKGEATFIKVPDKENILIDAGSMTFSDGGAGIITAFLKGEGVNQIDNIFLSHLHSDHYSAVFELAKHFKIKRIFLPDIGKNEHISKKLIYDINMLADKISYVNTATEIPKELSFISVLSPPVKNITAENNYLYLNENSMVLHFSYQNFKGLFAGDIERKGIDFLLSNDVGEIDFIKVPHHGGIDSFSLELYNQYNPKVAVLFRDRKVNFKDLLLAFEKNGSLFFDTFSNGAVTITKDKNFYFIKAYKNAKTVKIKNPLTQKDV